MGPYGARPKLAPRLLRPASQRPKNDANFFPKILDWLRATYRLGCERHRQRRELMEMDYRQLKDIGITPEQAEQEARKPIWKS